MALQLRKARVTDLPAIYRGEKSYIRALELAHETAWRADLERHLTRWVEHFERLTVAVVDEVFAGYSLWIPEGDCAELCTLHVAPDLRRSGIFCMPGNWREWLSERRALPLTHTEPEHTH